MIERQPVAGPKHRPRHRRVAPALRRRLALTLAVLLLGATAGAAVTLWRAGYRVYVVHTGSMEPTFRPGDLIVDEPVTKVRPGEVITFRHSAYTSDVVTHRVASVTATGLIETKGDANRSADAWQIHPQQVQGRVALHLRALGFLAVYLRQPSGIASLLIAGLGIVLLWGMFFPDRAEAGIPA